MSQIKLKHSGGNGVIIAAPSSNPAADRTLLLPGDKDSTIDTLGRTGNILQVVQGHITSSVTINSTTPTDVVSASITPSATSSKVLCLVNFHPKTNGSTSQFQFGAFVKRDSTTIVNDNEMFQANNDFTANIQMCSYSILDEPSSTSSLTYKLQAFRNASLTGRNMFFEASSTSSGDYWKTHTITLMEIS